MFYLICFSQIGCVQFKFFCYYLHFVMYNKINFVVNSLNLIIKSIGWNEKIKYRICYFKNYLNNNSNNQHTQKNSHSSRAILEINLTCVNLLFQWLSSKKIRLKKTFLKIDIDYVHFSDDYQKNDLSIFYYNVHFYTIASTVQNL